MVPVIIEPLLTLRQHVAIEVRLTHPLEGLGGVSKRDLHGPHHRVLVELRCPICVQGLTFTVFRDECHCPVIKSYTPFRDLAR